MENIRKSKLAVALTAALGLGAFAGSAQAVNVATDGIGEISYVPYFSVTKGQEEYIKLVNTSNKTIAVKAIFRRGTDSLEVRDFNIILSPYDEWVGKIVPTADGNAKVVTSDTTCTSPNKDQWVKEADGSYSVAFDANRFGTNVVVTSQNVLPGSANSVADVNTVSAASLIKDIREGYVYFAVMGENDPRLTVNTPNSVPFLSKHVNGVPRDCASIDWGFANALDSIQGQFVQPNNNIRVISSLVDVTGKSSIEVPVTTFANAFNTTALIFAPEKEDPSESFVDKTSDVFDDKTGTAVAGTLDAGQRSLTTTIQANSVIGTYDSTNGQLSNWIVDFPTKRSILEQLKPAIQPFEGPTATIGKTFFGEEEETSSTKTNFSPYAQSTSRLPYEVNVLSFKSNNSLASGLNTDAQPAFNKGWLSLTFPKSTAVTSVDAKVTYTGLPVIGFEVSESNGVASSARLSTTKGIVSTK